MEFAVSYAREIDYKRIILWVLEENYRARKFYEKCGFSFDGGKKELVYGKTLVAMRYAMKL